MPLVRLDLTALAGQTVASRTYSSHGTEGQSPCAAHSRDSTGPVNVLFTGKWPISEIQRTRGRFGCANNALRPRYRC